MSAERFEGKTLEEAIIAAEQAIGAVREDLTINVIEESDRGMLGIKWGKKVVIEAVMKGAAPAAAASTSAPSGALIEETVKRLLELTNIVASVSVKETFDEVIVTLSADENEEALLIGRRGKNLDAYQYMVNKIAESKSGDRGKRIVLDCADYRERRKEKLQSMARKAAYSVKKDKKSYSFPPMPAWDRRILHMTLKEEGLQTESKGFGEEKKVVVFPQDSR